MQHARAGSAPKGPQGAHPDEATQKLAARGLELPVFASPTIPGVTLHDTDVIYGVYRERMIEAQRKHLPEFKRIMAGEG